MYRIIIFAFCLSFMSCSDSDSCEEVGFNEAFKIEADKTYCFEDGTELLVRAINNEFCPCDAICVWEGQMTVDMTWTFPGVDPIEFVHNGSGSMINDDLPMGLKVASGNDNIEFEEECTDSNPSPVIISTLISVFR